jgi:TatD DNase family protein
MLVDSHCHLNFDELYNNLDDYLKRMQDNRVDYALCIGTRLDNLSRVVDIATTVPNLFATVGVHPDEDSCNGEVTKDDLNKFLANPKVVGIGETGLDYYREDNPQRSIQQNRFRTHIEVATTANLPLIIHTRNAFDDTISILKEYALTNNQVVMHCFTESVAEAKICIDLGFYISISGIVTFKSATQVAEMAKYVPLDRLLVETDAPFLAPVPFRGKLNHPALVLHTAEFLANLKGVPFTALAEATTDNFFRLFSKAKGYLNKHE